MTICCLRYMEESGLRRLGLLSGKIYSDEDYQSGKIQECCFMIPRNYSDKDIENEYNKRNLYCQCCQKCPAAAMTKKKSIGQAVKNFLFSIKKIHLKDSISEVIQMVAHRTRGAPSGRTSWKSEQILKERKNED